MRAFGELATLLIAEIWLSAFVEVYCFGGVCTTPQSTRASKPDDKLAVDQLQVDARQSVNLDLIAAIGLTETLGLEKTTSAIGLTPVFGHLTIAYGRPARRPLTKIKVRSMGS